VKLFTVFFLIFPSLHSAAAPKGWSIEIRGLVPGVTSKAEADLVIHDNELEIGGHTMPCVPEYVDNVLYSLVCLFGEKPNIKYTKESNQLVFSDLFIGLEKKFKSKPIVNKTIVRNGLGVQHTDIEAIWKDDVGNSLRLGNMLKTVNDGYLIISSKRLNSDAEKKEKELEAKKKF
jgi:hypothetical protein